VTGTVPVRGVVDGSVHCQHERVASSLDLDLDLGALRATVDPEAVERFARGRRTLSRRWNRPHRPRGTPAARGSGPDWEGLFRLSRFAADNGLVFEPLPGRPNYPGVMFSPGRLSVGMHVARRSGGRFFDVGNAQVYLGTTSWGDLVEDFGFVAVHLGARMPHLLLDARANNGLLARFGASFDGRGRVGLEGDFDRHFTLHCPPGYERDALYVLTPDLMALFIDDAGDLDAEIVDDWLLLSSRTPFDLADPAVWERISAIVSRVGAKTVRRSAGYRDERAQHAGSVASPGARLVQRMPVKRLVAVVAISALVILAWAVVATSYVTMNP